ncbi:hypothetical protein EXIGLDRAFT_726346 [Exidia glandulosa HHB12029]|uniref:Concanavalin A-like lectin/glucanase n=1 Tax=Exidia glandulosa HHB12029 TaxID=1314781 RepID=A0A165DS18_EXIGL|nr:hypothetical protein EXIGLDRAFT_726346 [Exidia glandulosa HHB12029]
MKFTLAVVAAAASAALAAPQASSANPHTTAANPHATDAAANPHATAAQEPDIKIPYGPSNALWTLQPADPTAWAVLAAPGVFNQTAHFAIKDADKAMATFAPPQPFVGFEFWGYQRSDGGIYMLTIDGKPTARIDVYNKTAGPDDVPVLLYSNVHLERKHHIVQIQNLVDPRVHKAGQFNIDHVVVTAAADAPRTETEPTAPSTPAPSTPSSPSSVPAPSSPSSTPISNPPATSNNANTDGSTGQEPGSGAGALVAPSALLSLLVAGALALF